VKETDSNDELRRLTMNSRELSEEQFLEEQRQLLSNIGKPISLPDPALSSSLNLAAQSIIANGKAETVEEALDLIDQFGL
jgi:hypothetical protein